MRDSRLLKMVKDNKLLPEDQLRQAIEYKKKLGADVGLADVMVRLGFVDEKRMRELLAESEAVPVINIDDYAIDPEAMEKLPRDFLKKHWVLPLADEKGKILLATAEPVDLETVEEIQFMTNCLVETALAPREQIKKALQEYDSISPHERKARVWDAAAHAAPAEPKPIPKSPHLAEILAEILIERGLVTREEITARLKTREL